MTKTPITACDRIIELSEKATEGPWEATHGQVCNWRMVVAQFVAKSSEDAAFCATARTIAPKIAAALNEAVRAIEEAEHATSCPWMPQLWRDQLKDCADMYNCTCWKQTALARITELLK